MTSTSTTPLIFAAKTGPIVRVLFALSIPLGMLGAFICFSVATTEPYMTMGDRLGLAAGGLFFSIFFVVPLVLWLMKRGRRITATDAGLEDRAGSKIQSLAWSQIEDLYYFEIWRPVTGTVAALRVEGPSGKLRAHNLWVENLPMLVARIREHIEPRQVTAANEAWQSNRPLVFGPLTLTREGVRKGNKVLSWDEVDRFRITTMDVSVFKKGRFVPWATFDNLVPNVRVFQHVVTNLAGKKVA